MLKKSLDLGFDPPPFGQNPYFNFFFFNEDLPNAAIMLLELTKFSASLKPVEGSDLLCARRYSWKSSPPPMLLLNTVVSEGCCSEIAGDCLSLLIVFVTSFT